MQTFPSVVFHNILAKRPDGFRRRGEKFNPGGRITRKNLDELRGFRRQAAPSPVRAAPAVTAPVRQLTK